jgi:electron transport complex protein RnfB
LVGTRATYTGLSSCRAAVLVNGGGRACEWGCLGLGDCAAACDFEAIHMEQESFSARGLPVVNVDKCTACNDCVVVCPLDLFVLVPASDKLFVQCNTPLEGEAARAACDVACDACGRCAADAPLGTVVMRGGLPIVRFDLAERPTVEATYRCPTGSIQWVEGQQFVTPVGPGVEHA